MYGTVDRTKLASGLTLPSASVSELSFLTPFRPTSLAAVLSNLVGVYSILGLVSFTLLLLSADLDSCSDKLDSENKVDKLGSVIIVPLAHYTVKPPIKDTRKENKPPNKGQA